MKIRQRVKYYVFDALDEARIKNIEMSRKNTSDKKNLIVAQLMICVYKLFKKSFIFVSLFILFLISLETFIYWYAKKYKKLFRDHSKRKKFLCSRILIIFYVVMFYLIFLHEK